MNGEADLVPWFADDLDVDGCRSCGTLSGVAAVGEGLGHERERPTRQAQDDRGTVAILHAGGLRLKDQSASIGIDHDLALATFHLLSRHVANQRNAVLFGGRSFGSRRQAIPPRNILFVVIALPERRLAGRAPVAGAAAFALGLTGVSSCALLPVTVLYAVARRSRPHAAAAGGCAPPASCKGR